MYEIDCGSFQTNFSLSFISEEVKLIVLEKSITAFWENLKGAQTLDSLSVAHTITYPDLP